MSPRTRHDPVCVGYIVFGSVTGPHYWNPSKNKSGVVSVAWTGAIDGHTPMVCVSHTGVVEGMVNPWWTTSGDGRIGTRCSVTTRAGMATPVRAAGVGGFHPCPSVPSRPTTDRRVRRSVRPAAARPVPDAVTPCRTRGSTVARRCAARGPGDRQLVIWLGRDARSLGRDGPLAACLPPGYASTSPLTVSTVTTICIEGSVHTTSYLSGRPVRRSAASLSRPGYSKSTPRTAAISGSSASTKT